MKKAIIGYLLIILFVFGKILIPPTGQIINGDDINHQYYFYRQFFNNFIHQGIFPWWNPYNFSGNPFIANPVVNIWYPLTWIFVFLPLNLAYSWHLAFHVVFAMTGMYWLVRRWSGALPAWVSGVVFGLSGFFMARVWAGHVDVIAAASWMPWVIGAFLGQNIIIAAVTLALQIYAGYQTMAFFTLETVIVIALFRKTILRSLGAIALGLGLAGLQIIPEQEFFRQSIRTFAFPYSWISYGSVPINELKQLFEPFFFGDQMTYHGSLPNYAEHAMFVGRIPLLLALIGIFFTKKKIIIPLILVALFGLWMTVGKFAPIDLQHILWKLVPMYHYLRIPSRHIILFVFGMSILAGFGLGKIKIKALQIIFTALIALEMVFFAKHFIALRNIPETNVDQQLISTLTKDPKPYRVLQNFGVWLPQRDALDFDASMAQRIFSATGYDPSILRNYYEFVAKASGTTGQQSILNQDVQVPYLNAESSDALDFLNIKYIVVPSAHDPFIGNTRYRLISHNTTYDYLLYENTTVFPRFFLENSKCGSVDIQKYTPTLISLFVNSTCDTNVESSEVFYPGWQAIIDGKEAPIFESNLAFRSVSIPRGTHKIIFFYNPKVFIIGAIVSLISAGLLMIFFKKH